MDTECVRHSKTTSLSSPFRSRRHRPVGVDVANLTIPVLYIYRHEHSRTGHPHGVSGKIKTIQDKFDLVSIGHILSDEDAQEQNMRGLIEAGHFNQAKPGGTYGKLLQACDEWAAGACLDRGILANMQHPLPAGGVPCSYDLQTLQQDYEQVSFWPSDLKLVPYLEILDFRTTLGSAKLPFGEVSDGFA